MKKIVSLIFVCVLVIGVFAVNAFAEEEETTKSENRIVTIVCIPEFEMEERVKIMGKLIGTEGRFMEWLYFYPENNFTCQLDDVPDGEYVLSTPSVVDDYRHVYIADKQDVIVKGNTDFTFHLSRRDEDLLSRYYAMEKFVGKTGYEEASTDKDGNYVTTTVTEAETTEPVTEKEETGTLYDPFGNEIAVTVKPTETVTETETDNGTSVPTWKYFAVALALFILSAGIFVSLKFRAKRKE